MKKILILLFIALLSLSALANGVEIGGIYYVLDEETHTASVTYPGVIGDDNTYSGNLIIPDEVVYSNQTYLVSDVGSFTFFENVGLNSVKIPDSVTEIGLGAFALCSSLSTIVIPHRVTNIRERAFANCLGLFSITCLSENPPVLDSDVFVGVPTDIPLYVPAASIPLYQAAEQWKEFDIQPLFVEIEPVTPNTTELSWLPVDSASLYQLHFYTDSTCPITIDTTLYIAADSLNGGILQQSSSAPVHIKRVVLDDIGTVVVISIDPSSGTSSTTPFVVTVSTTSTNEVPCHFDIKVYSGLKVINEQYGVFVLNDTSVVVIGLPNITPATSLPTGIYDLQGHCYPVEAWATLPAGVYVIRKENRVEKIMKK